MNLGSQFFGTPSDSLGIIAAIFTVEKSITKIKSHHVIILFAKVCSTFKLIMQNLAGKIVDIAIEIHEAVSFRSLSSASKFMYNWNMRELANIFQGCYHANNIFANQPLCASKIS